MKELWSPSPEFLRTSNLKQYQDFLKDTHQLSFENYEHLWQWSVDNLTSFWKSIWEYFAIISHSAADEVLSSSQMPGAKWFAGSSLNYAEHLFRHENSERPAMLFTSEREDVRKVGWQEVREKVTALKNHLQDKGIKKGDRVAGYLPNIPETMMAFMAVNAIGAVWSCCSMDFGEKTVIDRFEQIKPKILIAADGYYYKTKLFNKYQSIEKIVDALPSIDEVIVVAYLDSETTHHTFRSWHDITADRSSAPLTFEPVPFDHPIWVLYSSGTTGKPKAITHSHGGVLLEHLKYLAFHNDVKKGENFFWFTTTGWMMWNFLQASMLVGATPVLYEGSPAQPDLDVLWRFADQLPIHHFGTSAPYLTALMKQQFKIPNAFRLAALRSIGSTGAPLPPDAFEYIYENISNDVWLCSMSGGTDVCTAFVGGVPSKPVIKGRIQGRALGVALEAYQPDGIKVRNQLGEMVIELPMPSMPIYFWNDPGNERYRSSYFEHFPGKWRHGDYINIYRDGSLTIHGRSDATLNRNGVRIGSAEIYNSLNQLEEISDGLVLNLEHESGDIMPLFVVLADPHKLGEDLIKKINTLLRTTCSPRHVPDMILSVPDIPYTLSGKKMEVPVKKLFMGLSDQKSVNKDAIRNPKAMSYFIDNLTKIKTQLGVE